MGWRGRGDSALFDKKLYLAAYYLGSRDLQADLAVPDGILERLKHKVTRDDLYYTWHGQLEQRTGRILKW